MTIVSMRELLRRAREGGYAVPYFEAWDQYSLEAVCVVAERLRAPLVLGYGAALADQDWLDGGGIEALAGLARGLAERASVPAAVLFNEARTLAHAERGLLAGCNTVMLDSAGLPYAEHVERTRELVELAHGRGAVVEAELGSLPDAGDPSDQAEHTDPALARAFVEATGVDALAVSIGNVHLMVEGESSVDLDLLEQLQRAVPVPLVIHGGSGFPATAVRPALARGVCKFNVGTCLKLAVLRGLREASTDAGDRPEGYLELGSRKAGDVLRRANEGMFPAMAELTQLYGAAGRA